MKHCILITLTILFSACNNTPPAMNETDSEKIRGKWEWLKTEGGWGGIQTPESTGRTHHLYFEIDSVGFYYNDTLRTSLSYNLKKDKPWEQMVDSITVIIYNNMYMEKYYFSEGADTLTLDPRNYITDVGVSVYKRD